MAHSLYGSLPVEKTFRLSWNMILLWFRIIMREFDIDTIRFAKFRYIEIQYGDMTVTMKQNDKKLYISTENQD